MRPVLAALVLIIPIACIALATGSRAGAISVLAVALGLIGIAGLWVSRR